MMDVITAAWHGVFVIFSGNGCLLKIFHRQEISAGL
jgi:hypothetical protein